METSDPLADRKRGGLSASLVAVGVIYTLTTYFREYLSSQVLGLPNEFTSAYVRSRGDVHQAKLFVLYLPTVLALMMALLAYPAEFRRMLGVNRARSILAAALLTVIVSAGLDALNLWPFTWRWTDDSAMPYMAALVTGKQRLAIGLWVLTSCAVVPLVEESVFRYGLLRVIARSRRVAPYAVVISAFLFAVGHTGLWPIFPFGQRRVVVFVWTFSFGILLGLLANRGKKGIGIPIAIHVARNSLEVSTLVFAVTR